MRYAAAVVLMLLGGAACAEERVEPTINMTYRDKAAIPIYIADTLACGGILEGARCIAGCMQNGCEVYICQNGQIVRHGAAVCWNSAQPYCSGFKLCP